MKVTDDTQSIIIIICLTVARRLQPSSSFGEGVKIMVACQGCDKVSPRYQVHLPQDATLVYIMPC